MESTYVTRSTASNGTRTSAANRIGQGTLEGSYLDADTYQPPKNAGDGSQQQESEKRRRDPKNGNSKRWGRNYVWNGGLERGDCDVLIQIIKHELSSWHPQIDTTAGTIHLDEGVHLRLEPLAKSCAVGAASQWRYRVRAYVSNAVRPLDENDLREWELIKERLRLTLISKRESVGYAVIGTALQDVMGAICIMNGGTLTPVPLTTARTWGKSAGTIGNIALNNTLNSITPKVLRVKRRWIGWQGDPQVGVHILSRQILNSFGEETQGVLVSVPRQNLILINPLRKHHQTDLYGRTETYALVEDLGEFRQETVQLYEKSANRLTCEILYLDRISNQFATVDIAGEMQRMALRSDSQFNKPQGVLV